MCLLIEAASTIYALPYLMVNVILSYQGTNIFEVLFKTQDILEQGTTDFVAMKINFWVSSSLMVGNMYCMIGRKKDFNQIARLFRELPLKVTEDKVQAVLKSTQRSSCTKICFTIAGSCFTTGFFYYTLKIGGAEMTLVLIILVILSQPQQFYIAYSPLAIGLDYMHKFVLEYTMLGIDQLRENIETYTPEGLNHVLENKTSKNKVYFSLKLNFIEYFLFQCRQT